MNDQADAQNVIRSHFAGVLQALRELQEIEKQKGPSETGRALAIAITQTEIASMCSIRSFFATEPYNPEQKLQPKNE